MAGKLRPDTSIREIREQARSLGIDDHLVMSTRGLRGLQSDIAVELRERAEAEESEEQAEPETDFDVLTQGE